MGVQKWAKVFYYAAYDDIFLNLKLLLFFKLVGLHTKMIQVHVKLHNFQFL